MTYCRLPGHGRISEIVYNRHLNCYLLSVDSFIYRKDIDKKLVYIYLRVNCGVIAANSLKYSNFHKRLFINKFESYLSVVNPRSKKVEINMRKKTGDKIGDFKLFGQHDNRLVSVTFDGYVALYNLTHNKKRGVISQSRLDLISQRREQPTSIAVCNKNRYLLVEISEGVKWIYGKMVVLIVRRDSLSIAATIDQFDNAIGSIRALECCGYAGNHILWVGLTEDTIGTARVYDYDPETGVLAERGDKRVDHEELYPKKLHFMNGKFYYSGMDGQLMSLRVYN